MGKMEQENGGRSSFIRCGALGHGLTGGGVGLVSALRLGHRW